MTDTASSTILVTRKYSDLNLDFTKTPNSNDVSIKKDVEAVKRAVRYLVLTQNYERPFQPGIGCKVYRLLFELVCEQTTYEIQRSIEDVINNYEPRANLLSVSASPTVDGTGYDINIYFTIQNVTKPIQLTLFLQRTR